MNEENEQDVALEHQEDAALEPANEQPEETVEELRARLAKADEIAHNQTIRAEKAERALKKPTASAPAPKQSPKAGEIQQEDLYALIKADVPQEDISDVKEYAQMKGITVAEALKSNVVKTILADKAEQRSVAAATNVGTVRRGSTATSEESLLEQASKGQLPDSDEDLVRLTKARKGLK